MYLFVCLDKCIYVYTHKQRIQVLSFEQTFRSTAFFSCSQEKGEGEHPVSAQTGKQQNSTKKEMIQQPWEDRLPVCGKMNVLTFPCFIFRMYLGVAVTTCWNTNVLSSPCFVVFFYSANNYFWVAIRIEPLGEVAWGEYIKACFCCILLISTDSLLNG